jgi:S-adenosyl-L-methionine hydrolase (adenosine-forming)
VSGGPPVISFLTDYGLRDGFVGVCHGVIARGCPDARVIDLTHDVPRHDVRAGALLLRSSIEFLPDDTVHLAVVDPGVGTARRAIAVRAASGAHFTGPDNGLLAPAAERAGGIVEAADIGASPFALSPVSATFHGRDVFAPVAAALAGGRSLSEVGEGVDPATVTALELTRAAADGDTLVAHVQYIDAFGNLQLDAEAGQLAPLQGAPQLTVSSAAWDLPPQRVRQGVTFGDVETGDLLLYEDGHRRPAIAVNRGSAAERLGVAVGDELRIAAADRP